MATDGAEDKCRLCGKRIDGEVDKWYVPYHSNCFKCSSCKVPLNPRNYFLTNKKQFYCFKHYDHDGPDKHGHFFRELKQFRKYSIEKSKTSTVNGKTSPVKQHYQKNGLVKLDCKCSSGKSSGYWYECTFRNCPSSQCYLKSRDFKHFHVATWKITSGRSTTQIEHSEEELYEMCYHGQRHANFYSVDERIGPIVLSLKHESIMKIPFYRILLRSSSHITEGLIPTTSFCLNDYDDNAVLEVISRELDLTSDLRQFNDSIPPTKLLLLDKVMLKSEFKIGVVFVDKDQLKEEQFFTNTTHSDDFEEFLTYLGEKISLKGFNGYSGGLDTDNGLTGEHSIYKEYHNFRMMFHVSTLLPMEEHDDQKLQRKRHIGNDIVCIIFLAPGARFDPNSIKSNFLHVFIIIQPQILHGELFYKVDVASRDFVQNYGPPLPKNKLFKNDSSFQRWLYAKIINGERASYRSPKFASMQERTRRQLLEELVHDQACKEVQPSLKFSKNPFQRLLPLRHSFTRSSPHTPSLQRSMSFAADHIGITSPADQLRRDLKRSLACGISQYHDVIFLVGKERGGSVPAVKALLAMKSRVFNEMFFPGSYQSSAPRRRSSVLSRVSPHYLSQHLRSSKRLSDFWKRNNNTTANNGSTTSTTTASSSNDSSPSKNNNHSPESSIVDIKEGQLSSKLQVTEFDMEEFSALIEYIQTGSCVITPETVVGLACAAEYYQVDELIDLCERSCQQMCDIRNLPVLLTSIRQHILRYSIAIKLEQYVKSFTESCNNELFDFFDISSLSHEVFDCLLTSTFGVDDSKKREAIEEWHERLSTFLNANESVRLKDLLLQHADIDSTQLKDEGETMICENKLSIPD
uniref:Uncharacterized protein n=2 Tax=Clytia hemisphaerica TaxID=252671 RepID=A0A7M6DN97_9CNID